MAHNTTTTLLLSLLILSFFDVDVKCDSLTPPTTVNCPSPPPPPPPPPTPSPKPDPTQTHCPRDVIKFGACADIPGLIRAVMGHPPSRIPCCKVLGGLAGLEMAMCLCIAIKANILGINLNVPIASSIILSACQKSVPPGFKCQAQ